MKTKKIKSRNSNDDDENIFETCLINFPILQSTKESTIYERVIEFFNDNYYDEILLKTNLKCFVPYDEPHMFDLKNIIKITYQHDMRI